MVYTCRFGCALLDKAHAGRGRVTVAALCAQRRLQSIQAKRSYGHVGQLTPAALMSRRNEVNSKPKNQNVTPLCDCARPLKCERSLRVGVTVKRLVKRSPF